MNLQMSNFVKRQVGKPCQPCLKAKRLTFDSPIVSHTSTSVSLSILAAGIIIITFKIIIIISSRVPLRPWGLCSPDKKWPCAGQGQAAAGGTRTENEILKLGRYFHLFFRFYQKTNTLYEKAPKAHKRYIFILKIFGNRKLPSRIFETSFPLRPSSKLAVTLKSLEIHLNFCFLL